MLRRGEDVSYDVLIEREREIEVESTSSGDNRESNEGSGDIFTALTEAGRMGNRPDRLI